MSPDSAARRPPRLFEIVLGRPQVLGHTGVERGELRVLRTVGCAEGKAVEEFPGAAQPAAGPGIGEGLGGPALIRREAPPQLRRRGDPGDLVRMNPQVPCDGGLITAWMGLQQLDQLIQHDAPEPMGGRAVQCGQSAGQSGSRSVAHAQVTKEPLVDAAPGPGAAGHVEAVENV
ncbi:MULTISPECIES: hypothetical protein [unclassified Streptomyces]|uniref:hypothetical protein n=1 Tax=unclassified Streptomyces TaxID=2593676 RepID=UPI002E2E8409|nr:hypothetical protein [Streptomyces sp. NBC_01453]